MNTYAIIKLGGFQYTVEEGKEYTVPKFQADSNADVKIDQVFAVGSEDTLIVGKPTVESAKVTIHIIDQAKGDKIQTRIYRAKDRYRKAFGTRKEVTRFSVVSIEAAGVAKTVKPKKAEKEVVAKEESPKKVTKAKKTKE
jgi:large subunit ribosomal protein L21